MLFVSGANGHFGGAVIANLLQSVDPADLIVGTRDPGSAFAQELAGKGVSVRKADFDDPASLPRAMEGADKVLIIPTWSSNDIRLNQNTAAIDAAKQAGARQLVYASFVNANPNSLAEHNQRVHYPTEQAVLASGLAYTILRHALYAEILVNDLADTIRTGEFCRAGGESRSAYIPRNDLGVSAARVLSTSGHENRIYTETMEQTWSGADLAALMSEVLGTNIRYREVPADEWAQFMHEKWGVPLEAARSSIGTMRAIESGEFDIATQDYAAIVGHPPTSMRHFLESARDRLQQG